MSSGGDGIATMGHLGTALSAQGTPLGVGGASKRSKRAPRDPPRSQKEVPGAFKEPKKYQKEHLRTSEGLKCVKKMV